MLTFSSKRRQHTNFFVEKNIPHQKEQQKLVMIRKNMFTYLCYKINGFYFASSFFICFSIPFLHFWLCRKKCLGGGDDDTGGSIMTSIGPMVKDIYIFRTKLYKTCTKTLFCFFICAKFIFEMHFSFLFFHGPFFFFVKNVRLSSPCWPSSLPTTKTTSDL